MARWNERVGESLRLAPPEPPPGNGSREHTADVLVDRCCLDPETECQHGPGAIGPDPGQGEQCVEFRWNLAAVALGDE